MSQVNFAIRNISLIEEIQLDAKLITILSEISLMEFDKRFALSFFWHTHKKMLSRTFEFGLEIISDNFKLSQLFYFQISCRRKTLFPSAVIFVLSFFKYKLFFPVAWQLSSEADTTQIVQRVQFNLGNWS